MDEIFKVLQSRLPPPDKRIENFSELDFSDTSDLEKMLDQGDLVIADYTNSWLTTIQRFSDFFVAWTFAFLGILLVSILIGGPFGKIPDGHNVSAVIAWCGLGLLGGFGVATKYSLILPPMKTQRLTVIDGSSREMVYACRSYDDNPTWELIRAPIDDFSISISWTQVADHAPSFLSVYLSRISSLREKSLRWPSQCMATVRHNYPAPVPKALMQKAENFARVLGIKCTLEEQVD